MESLALKYRYVFERTEQLSGRSFSGLHAVGGGIQNELLCQFTANAIRREVWAGPVEASALGNLIVQFISLGVITDLNEARTIIRNSFSVKTYVPEEKENWQRAYERFCQIVSR
jgi:rhamnulokinase